MKMTLKTARDLDKMLANHVMSNQSSIGSLMNTVVDPFGYRAVEKVVSDRKDLQEKIDSITAALSVRKNIRKSVAQANSINGIDLIMTDIRILEDTKNFLVNLTMRTREQDYVTVDEIKNRIQFEFEMSQKTTSKSGSDDFLGISRTTFSVFNVDKEAMAKIKKDIVKINREISEKNGLLAHQNNIFTIEIDDADKDTIVRLIPAAEGLLL